MIADACFLLVLFGGLALLMILVVRGKSIFVVAPLCALLVTVLSGEDPVARMTGPYMEGFSQYVKQFYLLFALGAVFGKLMDRSGAASSVATLVAHRFGAHRACLAVVLASAVLTYGGVSLFVVGFSVYPLAVQLFRAANLPRQFIPAAIAFGSITFTMTSAGSPEVQNLIPMKYLIDKTTGECLTDARAGWQVSLIVAALMFGLGQWYLDRAIRQATKLGGHFEPRESDRVSEAHSKGNVGFLMATCPLLATLLSLNLLPWICHRAAESVSVESFPRLHAVLEKFPEDGTLAIFLGVVVAVILLHHRIDNLWGCFGEGFLNGLLAVGSTSAVVGFGYAVRDLRAFHLVEDWVTHLPGDPLISAALAVAIIAAIAGSASGGQAIALPIIKPIYLDEMGVSPRALHRIVAISSGTLDSLPANGYLVMLIREICGETHARAYYPIFITTVLIPAGGTVVAIALFNCFPQWN
jgi:H+/gluconate symporter-like permease